MSNFIYQSTVFNKLINKFVRKGKKERFENMFYRMFLRISRITKIPSIFYIFEILEKQKPIFGKKAHLTKKKTLYVPVILTLQQQYFVAISFLYQSVINSRLAIGRPIEKNIYNVLFSYYNSKDKLFLKGLQLKRDLYISVIKNRSLKHFR